MCIHIVYIARHKQGYSMKNRSNYITITEATAITGKHKDTIRRLVKTHKTSGYIATGKKHQYLIDKQWLLDMYDINDAPEAPISDANIKDDTQPSPNTPDSLHKTLEALTAQLEAKDKQIERQQSTIDKLASDYSLLFSQSQTLQGYLLPAQNDNKPAPAVEVIQEAPKKSSVNRTKKKPSKKSFWRK